MALGSVAQESRDQPAALQEVAVAAEENEDEVDEVGPP